MSGRAIALLAAVAVAGCGGESSAGTAVRGTVQRWTHAVVARDSEAACAELSARLRRSIDRHLLGEGVSGSCRTWAARWVSPRHPAARRGARVTTVEVHGHRAVAHVVAPGTADADAQLVEEDGAWRVDDY